jgi:hypothetical protein
MTLQDLQDEIIDRAHIDDFALQSEIYAEIEEPKLSDLVKGGACKGRVIRLYRMNGSVEERL